MLKPCTRLGIETTWRCNWSCQHCFYLRNQNFKKKIDVPLEALKLQIDNGINRGMNHVVSVGYGEPFLSPCFQDMLKYCKEKNIPTSVITNGTMNISDYEQAFGNGLNHIHLSFHGIGETLNKIANSPTAYEKQETLRTYLKQQNRPWRCNTTIQKDNLNELNDIVTKAIDNNVFHYVFLNFLPHYEWSEHVKDHAEHPAIIAPKIMEAADILIKNNIYFTIRYFPFCFIDSKYWKYIVNSYYVAYDPWEWSYNDGCSLIEKTAEMLRSHVEISSCKSCIAYRHCAGWNRTYDATYGHIVKPIKAIPDEYRDKWDEAGSIFLMNPVNLLSGTI